MTSDNLEQLVPAWLALTSQTEVSLGLEPAEAFARAEQLLADLRDGRTSAASSPPDAEQAEILHALVAVVCRDVVTDVKSALADVEVTFNYISSLPWPANLFGSRSNLLSACALHGWRLAHRSTTWRAVEGWANQVHRTSDAAPKASGLLQIPDVERSNEAVDISNPEFLICLCEILRSRPEIDPNSAKTAAEFFYATLEKNKGQIESEHESGYFLGELALIAGVANRILFRTADATHWLDLADASFSCVSGMEVCRLRVAYQRLALLAEERRVDEASRAALRLATTFRRLQMPEDAIKCRFLKGIAEGEAGRFTNAIETFGEILEDALQIGSTRLAAQALNNLARFHADLGENEQALSCARRALPLLQQLGNQMTLVKLRWTIGQVLHKQKKYVDALEAYREALKAARDLGMRSDVVAIHVVIASALLEAGEEAQAEREIRAALPIIDEEKMVPEGIAALSLLRESLRRRQIDKQALRDLHGYFQEK